MGERSDRGWVRGVTVEKLRQTARNLGLVLLECAYEGKGDEAEMGGRMRWM